MIKLKKVVQPVFVFFLVFSVAALLLMVSPAVQPVNAFSAPESFSELAESVKPGCGQHSYRENHQGRQSGFFGIFSATPLAETGIHSTNFLGRSRAMASNGTSSSAAWAPDFSSIRTGSSLPTTM